MAVPFAKPGSGACVAPRLSVVIPAHDEGPNVRPLLEEVVEALVDREPYEVILVDDGSTDDTAGQARRFGREVRPLRLLRHATRRGQSRAVFDGVRAATAELVVVLDGDLQNVPYDINVLLDAFLAEAGQRVGAVCGHRVDRKGSRPRRVASRIANAVRRGVLGDATPDTGCGLKLIRRSVFNELPYFNHMHRFLPALVLRAGFRVISVPVRHRERRHGRSHYGIWDRLWVGIADLAGVAWLMRRSTPDDLTEE